MACKYTYKGITYNSKEEFINQVINPQFLSNKKVRRVLELQSDLFQKGRGKNLLTKSEDIINPHYKKENFNNAIPKQISNNKWFILLKEDTNGFNDEYYIPYNSSFELEFKTKKEAQDYINNIQKPNSRENQFLQLLNKKNNWVTFFVQSIIQDSAKKGYEKVLFPKGDTAAKIEGHQTLEEFKKQKEARIKELEKQLETAKEKPKQLPPLDYNPFREDLEIPTGEAKNLEYKKDIENEIKTLKQELADVESGKTQLSSIANFYENTIFNILKKNGYNPVEITDEYGNKWNEISIKTTKKAELDTTFGLGMSIADHLKTLSKEQRAKIRSMIKDGRLKTKCK